MRCFHEHFVLGKFSGNKLFWWIMRCFQTQIGNGLFQWNNETLWGHTLNHTVFTNSGLKLEINILTLKIADCLCRDILFKFKTDIYTFYIKYTRRSDCDLLYSKLFKFKTVCVQVLYYF